MVDDRPEDATLADASRPRREPPTIDLEATDVSEAKPAVEEAEQVAAGPAAEAPLRSASQPVSPWAIAPISGAVLVFERGSGGHVGFAIGQDATQFYVLGGNQSDAVTIARIAKSRLLGARWPATVPPRLQRLPTMKPGEYLRTTNEA